MKNLVADQRVCVTQSFFTSLVTFGKWICRHRPDGVQQVARVEWTRLPGEEVEATVATAVH